MWAFPCSFLTVEPTFLFIFYLENVSEWLKVAQSCLTFCDPMDCSPPGSSVHGIFQPRNTGVGCHFLLQGIFPSQGSNPHLLHWQTLAVRFLTTEPSGFVLWAFYRLISSLCVITVSLLPFYRWRKWSREKLNDFLRSPNEKALETGSEPWPPLQKSSS